MSRRQEGLRRGRGRARQFSPAVTPRTVATLEPLEDRRLMSAVGGVELPGMRLLGVTGNKQLEDLAARFEDETLYEYRLATPDTPQELLLDGIQDVPSDTGIVALTRSSTVGVTQGSGALRIDVTQARPTTPTDPGVPATFWGFQSGNVVDLLKAGADKLTYDLTLTNVELNGGAYGGGPNDNSFNGFAHNNELAVVIATPTGGFIQRNFTAGGLNDSSGMAATWGGVDGKRTISWDLTKFTGPGDASLKDFITTSGATDARFWFVTQGGDSNGNTGPMRFYFDNMVVSRPEIDAIDQAPFDVYIGDFDPIYNQKLLTLPHVPDGDSIGFNPADGMLYHAAGAESWSNNPNSPGFRDNQFLEKIDISGSLAQTPIYNANSEQWGLPAPRPAWVMPTERRTDAQTDASFRVQGPNEYHDLRDITWSAADNAFIGTDEDGLFKLTPEGVSTFLGRPAVGGGGLKGIAFATHLGERKLFVSQRDGATLWVVDPTTGQLTGESVPVYDPVTFDGPRGLLSLIESPEAGKLLAIASKKVGDYGNVFLRELIEIDLTAGGTYRSIGALGNHAADLAVVPAREPNVTEVYVRGSTWGDNPSFGTWLEANGFGDDVLGYRIDNVAANTTIPWTNVNQIVLRYGEAPTGAGVPTPGTLTLDGIRGDYDVTAVDPLGTDGRTFVLTLERPLGVLEPATLGTDGDRVLLTVPDAGPGDSDYRITLNSLQGDANQGQQRVTSVDVTLVRSRLNRSAAEGVPPGGAQPYSGFADLTANGVINSQDVTAVRARLNDTLPPPPEPAGDVFGRTTITEEVLSA